MSKNIFKKKSTYIFGGVFIVAAALVVVLANQMQGRTEIHADSTANVKSESVTCSGTGVEYPKLEKTYDAMARKVDLNLFFEDDKLTTVGMVYTLTYNNEEAAGRAGTLLSFDLGDALTAAGYNSTDGLGKKFTTRKNQVIINMYAEKREINNTAAPFFLISTDEAGLIVPKTKTEYTKSYKEQGFSCKDN